MTDITVEGFNGFYQATVHVSNAMRNFMRGEDDTAASQRTMAQDCFLSALPVIVGNRKHGEWSARNLKKMTNLYLAGDTEGISELFDEVGWGVS